MTTMRAAVFHNGLTSLVLQEIPIPRPGPKQVLLKVAAAGVCHSDTLLLSDTLNDPRKYVFGHENAGYAVELGKDVENIEIGKLYAIWDIVAHGPHQIPGLPPFADSIGIGENGGFAEFIVADASDLVPVPADLRPEVAALAADSLITVYNAVHNRAGLRPGTKQRVLIYGVGGLGHQAVQLAKSYGATVFACDIKASARELALSLGAEQAFQPTELTSLTSSTDESKNFQVDIVIDFVSNQQSFTIDQAVVKGHGNSLQETPGTIVMVGLFGDNLSFNIFELLIFRTNVLTSLYGTKDDLKASLALLAEGAVKPVVSAAPLEEVNKVLDELRAGRVTGRMVVVPGMKATKA
ncbi:N-benzyl-3-pyrrolidinol dehydrogenase [Dichomitus squalens]|uniref:N-benzyl-3-pyrrolidinol dehydrogenase n=1 Tax=Dichomitus squalens TaxID=114155 RepID=A0A4Q9PDQ7_9APHY|nr:N-benzyl-3-pyrrolidinol dehydrogenase [Dichomitus squalens]